MISTAAVSGGRRPETKQVEDLKQSSLQVHVLGLVQTKTDPLCAMQL